MVRISSGKQNWLSGLGIDSIMNPQGTKINQLHPQAKQIILLRLSVGFIVLAAFLLAPRGQAASFQVVTILQAGASGGGNWEVSSAGSPDPPLSNPIQQPINTYWQNGANWEFEIDYNQPGHLQVSVYQPQQNSMQTIIDYDTHQNAVGNTVWTLPASAFFVTALSGPTVSTQITVSGLTLSAYGQSTSLNILSPIQQTTLTASSGGAAGSQTITEGNNVVFQTDSNGQWALTGYITMTGIGVTGGATGNQLEFGVDTSTFTYTSTTPEPATGMLMLAGLGLLPFWKYAARKCNQSAPEPMR